MKAFALLLFLANCQPDSAKIAVNDPPQKKNVKPISKCIDEEKVKYGGDFNSYDYTYFCPTYHFAYDGDTAKSWSILNPIDIHQVSNTVFPIKNRIEKQIQAYAGQSFFSHLEFSSVDVVYPDSIRKFDNRGPAVDMSRCKSKYYFFYVFKADTEAVYNIGIAADEQGNILSPFNFPAEADYKPIDSTLTVCRVLEIAKKANRKINPVAEVQFEYNHKSKRFYWLVSQEIIDSHEGINKFNQVEIDASDPTNIKKQVSQARIVY
ncbi:hypothetical protein LJ737_07550 [Hymenobacter sp. 15J16-1T3B]|uniref:hypothetical protein n=1 Tax=Hymenobacter sp. 15J16-1T3B TaxID=2886941 RepID=UPI001D103B50|nr:hypothetical protein [Hymenobacter sp. 15J16-1T3B]MCC3157088.1 hypothetical protein [Hymenobacter sp. 15J16-1T3B]